MSRPARVTRPLVSVVMVAASPAAAAAAPRRSAAGKDTSSHSQLAASESNHPGASGVSGTTLGSRRVQPYTRAQQAENARLYNDTPSCCSAASSIVDHDMEEDDDRAVRTPVRQVRRITEAMPTPIKPRRHPPSIGTAVPVATRPSPTSRPAKRPRSPPAMLIDLSPARIFTTVSNAIETDQSSEPSPERQVDAPSHMLAMAAETNPSRHVNHPDGSFSILPSPLAEEEEEVEEEAKQSNEERVVEPPPRKMRKTDTRERSRTLFVSTAPAASARVDVDMTLESTTSLDALPPRTLQTVMQFLKRRSLSHLHRCSRRLRELALADCAADDGYKAVKVGFTSVDGVMRINRSFVSRYKLHVIWSPVDTRSQPNDFLRALKRGQRIMAMEIGDVFGHCSAGAEQSGFSTAAVKEARSRAQAQWNLVLTHASLQRHLRMLCTGQFIPQSLTALAAPFAQLKVLEKLRIPTRSSGDKLVGLHRLERLTDLTVTDEHTEASCLEAIRKCGKLQKLHLIAPKALCASDFAREFHDFFTLHASSHTLTSLTLSKMPVYDSVPFHAALKRWPRLREVTLVDFGASINAFLAYLHHASALERLTIRLTQTESLIGRSAMPDQHVLGRLQANTPTNATKPKLQIEIIFGVAVHRHAEAYARLLPNAKITKEWPHA